MFQGVLRKMRTQYATPVQYYLDRKDDFIHMNQVLGSEFGLEFIGYECLYCHENKPIYRMGFCQKCFFEAPEAADWILHPEMSKAHTGEEERNLAYEQEMQLQPHIVYLALSSELKVGVTRKSQIPIRWIDQGAYRAIEVLEVPNRYLAGIAEVALKEHFNDKTNWRRMLINDVRVIELLVAKKKLKSYLPDELRPFYLNDEVKITEIEYPVKFYPKKVQALNLDKVPIFKDKLIGIKGQYLIFETGTVFNVRGNEGYVVNIILG